ncbi:FAD binding domain-containing protein [Chloroflexota bacterium]
MNPLEFLEPKTLKEACTFISKYKTRAKFISGGQSLIPILQARLASVDYLIDLKGITNLNYIRSDTDSIRIGAVTTEQDIYESDSIRRNFPILAEAIQTIGSWQIRNWGTIGGSLAHADPSGDIAPVLIAYKARVKAQSLGGEREIPIGELLVDWCQNSLEADEVLTEIIIPYPKPISGGVYAKEVTRTGDTGISSLAVLVSLDNETKAKDASIVLGCQSHYPIRAIETEKQAIGLREESNTKDLEETIVTEANPGEDILGSIEYKLDLARILIRHAFPEAIKRAK